MINPLHVHREPGPDLCRILRIYPDTLARLLVGEFRDPEILNEIERRLRAAGLLPEARLDS